MVRGNLNTKNPAFKLGSALYQVADYSGLN
jgi:hypothetical protein